MKAKPSIVSAGDGRYRAEGVVFDRSGRWEIALRRARRARKVERLTHEIILK